MITTKSQKEIEAQIGQLNETRKTAQANFDKAFADREDPDTCRGLKIRVNYIDKQINALLWAIGMRETVD